MLETIASRTEALTSTRSTAPRAAEALLMLAGALLAITLPLASLGGGIPLGPLATWLGWMALPGVAAAVILARRSRLPKPGIRAISAAGPGGRGLARIPSRTA